MYEVGKICIQTKQLQCAQTEDEVLFWVMAQTTPFPFTLLEKIAIHESRVRCGQYRIEVHAPQFCKGLFGLEVREILRHGRSHDKNTFSFGIQMNNNEIQWTVATKIDTKCRSQAVSLEKNMGDIFWSGPFFWIFDSADNNWLDHILTWSGIVLFNKTDVFSLLPGNRNLSK